MISTAKQPILSSPPGRKHQYVGSGIQMCLRPSADRLKNVATHLADWAEKHRNALLCQLNSYPSQKEGAA